MGEIPFAFVIFGAINKFVNRQKPYTKGLDERYVAYNGYAKSSHVKPSG